MFYFVPETATSQDNTNILIREQIAVKNFNETLLMKTAEPISFPPVIEIETEDTTTTILPSIKLIQKEIDYQVVQLTLSLDSVKGFIVAGIIQGRYNKSAEDAITVGTISNYSLSTNLLRKGFYSYMKQLLKAETRFSAKDEEQIFLFNKLIANTTYTIFYGGSTDDPTIFADSTDVQILEVKTLSDAINVYLKSNRLFNSILGFIVCLFVIFI